MNQGVVREVSGGGYRGLLISILLVGITVLGTVFCATSLASAEGTTNTMYDDVTVEVASACSIGATNNEHTGNIESGNLTTIGNDSTFNITCNDADGYIVYVVGNTNDEEGNTDLIGSQDDHKIATGTNTSGDTSSWFFKLSNPSGLTINSGLDENSLIPSTRTNAVSRASGVSNPEGDTFTASYSAYISSLQPADTYTGKVKYLLFHPSSSDEEGNPPPIPTTMQEFGDYCNSMSQDQTLTLMDTRDSNTYTVARLKDNHCWMTQNLRLGDSKLKSHTLTTSDTDLQSGTYTLPNSSTSGFSDNSAQNIYVGSNETYGGYYTWPAATAGANPSSGEASSSICPKGWRLPTNAEFSALTSSYTYQTSQNAPANFVLAGYYYSSSLYGQGTNGYWWSSTAFDSSYAYYLYLYPDSSSFATSSDGWLGYSIRCVSRQ